MAFFRVQAKTVLLSVCLFQAFLLACQLPILLMYLGAKDAHSTTVINTWLLYPIRDHTSPCFTSTPITPDWSSFSSVGSDCLVSLGRQAVVGQ